MATAAEPTRASLPLPGGREGATVRLHPLLTAVMAWPDAWAHREEGRLGPLHAFGIGVSKEGLLECPIVAFLVEHPSAGPILIDTGFHASVAVDRAKNLGRIGALFARDLRMDADQAVPAQLRERGIDPADVGLVVMTHLHFDHASGIAEFPGATFVASSREWEAATAPRSHLQGYVRRQFDHGFDYRLVDFDAPGVDSFATFGRAVDVLGDGSIMLVSTPGHTAGHMSVVLRLQGREALIAADAIYTLKTLTESHVPQRMHDEHLFRRSLREIQVYSEQTPGALIVPGHDMEAWRALDGVYE